MAGIVRSSSAGCRYCAGIYCRHVPALSRDHCCAWRVRPLNPPSLVKCGGLGLVVCDNPVGIFRYIIAQIDGACCASRAYPIPLIRGNGGGTLLYTRRRKPLPTLVDWGLIWLGLGLEMGLGIISTCVCQPFSRVPGPWYAYVCGRV